MSGKEASTHAKNQDSVESASEELQVELSVDELERIAGGAHTIEHSGNPVPPPVIHRDITH